MLRDLADEPFVAMVIPEGGDAKIYVKGIAPEQMIRIQHAIERILAEPKDANPDDPDVVLGVARHSAEPGEDVDVRLT